MGQSASVTAAALLLLAPRSAPSSEATGCSTQAKTSANEQKTKEKEPRANAPPQTTIAGIAGFDSISKVEFTAAPQVRHELKVTCSLPERMRWMLSTRTGTTLEREIQYQYGDAVYRIPPRTGESQVCEGVVRAEILRRMELRRALMLYPDGFSWKGDGPVKTADLGERGALRAHVPSDAGGRPTAIEIVDAQSGSIDAWRAVTWTETAGRMWPATMELWHGDELVWKETVESVNTAARFVDSFFLPPDRREEKTGDPIGGAIRTLDIPETCAMRTSIATGTTWEAALRNFGELRESWAKRLADKKLELDRIATFEISDKGEPVASILRITGLPEEPPAGFSKQGTRKGLAMAVEGLAQVDGARITQLGRGLSKGAMGGRPYVRLDPAGGEHQRVVLVLPFETKR